LLLIGKVADCKVGCLGEEVMKSSKRKMKGRRFTKAHRDGKINTIKKNIAKTYDLPEKSIRFVKKDGRQMRGDAKISKLRSAWE